MQVFKTFMTIAKSKIGNCMIYLGIFAALILIFSNMGGDAGSEYVNYKCKLAIFDEDNSEESKRLVEFLTERNRMVEFENDEDLIQSKLYYAEVDYILYIKKGYSETGALENLKRPGSSSGSYVDNMITNYENSMEALILSGYTEDEAYELTLEAMSDKDLVTLQTEETKTRAYSFVYLPYVLLMALFNGVCPVLCGFNKRALQDRANISPFPAVKKNLQIVLGSVVVSLIILGVLVGVSLPTFPKAFSGEVLGLCVVNSFCFMLLGMGIVSIFGNFDLKPEQISIVSNIIGLGSSFLGGVFVTLEIFSPAMLSVAKFMPTYWYIQALDKICEGKAFSDYGFYMGVELLYALVLFVAAMVVSKRMRMARSE